ncbi:tRNA-splicing endonuclease subunit Sen34 [Taenia crassiceps]|uniref:tRNA-intron lyase n=1 Tax=Taenia crassiceps TaxID=6207 RepID=A0ABR4QIX5_9CEST
MRMTEIPKPEYADDEIVVQMSPWGEFFVWVARHVERLRREHRIVGHLSISPAATLGPSSSMAAKASSAYAVRLPLRLSLEETALLLFRRIIVAVDSIRPVLSLNPPSLHSLAQFDCALALHYAESMEAYRQRKHQRMLSYYDEILKGREKRKAREAAKAGNSCSTGVGGENQTVLYDENGLKLSKKHLKKLQRRKRRKVTSVVESTLKCPEEDYFDNEAEAEGQEEETNEPSPALEELMATTPTDDAQVIKHTPLHRPRPTPKEWRRDGEHTTLPIPDTARDSIEKVALWLLEISSKSRLEENENVVVRCKVFDDLWSRGFYITCSASKMGGDFLVYQGDPLFYHASHIVIASPPQAPIYLSRLSASLRIANSVRKALVLATTAKGNDRGVAYTSLYWMSFRSALANVDASYPTGQFRGSTKTSGKSSLLRYTPPGRRWTLEKLI